MYRLTIPSTLALMALASASVLSNAEVKTQHGIKKPTDLTKVEARVSARDTSNLRCWQYGELLFEETHLSEKKLSSTDNMLVIEHDIRINGIVVRRPRIEIFTP